jgi:hypothetical protein
MPQIIPLTNDPLQSETILGFDFRFYWNVRDNSWRMDISQNGAALIQGIKLVIGVLLLRAYALNIGEFLIFENSFHLSDPTRNGFSTGQYALIYYTQEEIDELLALR